MFNSFFSTKIHPQIFVSLIAFLVLVPGSFQLPLLDRDEPRFSRATVEMQENSDWIVPYFNSEYRFDKPPLTYWWMGFHHWVFGNNEFSSRLHSILATWLIALWMCARGKHWVGQQAAVLGSVAWLLNLQVWQHGRLALADMPMILFLCLAMYGLWTSMTVESKEKFFGPFLLWVGVALGFLAKGPIAVAVPFFVFIIYFLKNRKTIRPLKNLRPVVGVLSSLLLISLWGIPALIATDGVFAQEGLGTHVLERGISAFNQRSYTPFFYFVTFFLSFFPWWIQGKPIFEKLKIFLATKECFYLLSWFFVPFLLFSFYSTQLPHYLLPGFPPLFMIVGKGIEDAWNKQRKSQPIVEILFSILLLFSYLTYDQYADPKFPQSFVPWVGIILFCFVWIPYCFLNIKKIGFIFLLLGMAFSSANLARKMREEHLTIKILERSLVDPSDDIIRFSSSFAEPSLVYYLGGPWTFQNQLSQDVNSSRPVFQIERFESPVPDKEGILIEGFNPARGKREKIWVYPPNTN